MRSREATSYIYYVVIILHKTTLSQFLSDLFAIKLTKFNHSYEHFQSQLAQLIRHDGIFIDRQSLVQTQEFFIQT